jgi:Tfp pilus assembly protein, pilus retraction ATPase PilT
MSFLTQREVDVDTRSFAEALRSALRQDPDVILVGEMRDHETIETALTAAETGHLVLSTLHTLDATETITRIVSSFPSHQQKSVRIQLAGILKAVISMRLVRAAKGAGRVPAIEVLVSTGFIRDHIINEEKTYMIREAIAAGNFAIRDANLRSVAVPPRAVRIDLSPGSTSQRNQCRRVQDAGFGNLFGRL